jgi:hypothetical protein
LLIDGARSGPRGPARAAIRLCSGAAVKSLALQRAGVPQVVPGVTTALAAPALRDSGHHRGVSSAFVVITGSVSIMRVDHRRAGARRRNSGGADGARFPRRAR